MTHRDDVSTRARNPERATPAGAWMGRMPSAGRIFTKREFRRVIRAAACAAAAVTRHGTKPEASDDS